MRPTLLVIAGPTGIGKTGLAIHLAKKWNTCIISADSRQMYREMSIGTAIPNPGQLQEVKHHFIHNIGIHDYYNASMFEMEALELAQNLFNKQDCVIVAGGSGLYIDALCKGIDDLAAIDPIIRDALMERLKNEGLESLRMELKKIDPTYYAKADLKNSKRILKALEVFQMTGKPYSDFCTHNIKKRAFNICKIALNIDRDLLYKRIEDRTDAMVRDGWIDEAKNLVAFKNLNALNTVGYKELFEYLDEKISLDEAISLIKQNTRRYAKKQISYFKRDCEMLWCHPDDAEKAIKNKWPEIF